jgi:hypothetical protein
MAEVLIHMLTLIYLYMFIYLYVFIYHKRNPLKPKFVQEAKQLY